MNREPYGNNSQNPMMGRMGNQQKIGTLAERVEAMLNEAESPPPSLSELRANSPSISELRGGQAPMGPMAEIGAASPSPALPPSQAQPLNFSAGNPFAEHAMNLGFNDFQPQNNVVSLPAQETISKASPNMATQKAQASALRGGSQNG